MEDIMTEVIDVDGKEYFLVNTVDIYKYYACEKDPKDFLILKEIVDEGEEYIVSLDDDKEYDKALAMYYEKFGDVSV